MTWARRYPSAPLAGLKTVPPTYVVANGAAKSWSSCRSTDAYLPLVAETSRISRALSLGGDGYRCGWSLDCTGAAILEYQRPVGKYHGQQLVLQPNRPLHL